MSKKDSLAEESEAIETDLLNSGPPEETKIIKKSDVSKSNPDTLPFDPVEYEEISKVFYIPRSIYTDIQSGRYRTQKHLQLRTSDGLGLGNGIDYYKVKLVVEIPNSKVVVDSNELYKILTNCGVNTRTARIAIQTALEN